MWHFGPQPILAVLGYGTRFFNPHLTDRFSDYDITVVFRCNPRKPFPKLPKNVNTTILLWPDISKVGVKHFRLYNHGEFYLCVLANAVPLYGTNPFPSLAKQIPRARLLASLREQIFLHLAKLTHITLLQNDKRKLRDVRKYSFRIAQNVFFFLSQSVDYGPFLQTRQEDWLATFQTEKRFPGFMVRYLQTLMTERSAASTAAVLRFVHQTRMAVIHEP